jgi:hypothetical protein
MLLASWRDVLIAAPFAFTAGALVGFLASNRWKIIRRNGR